MKIIGEDSQKLTLKDTNYWGFIIGCILIIVGILLTLQLLSTLNSTNIISTVILVAALSLIMLLIGVVKFFSTFLSTIYFDKAQNKIKIERKTIRGTKTYEYTLNEVTELDLNKTLAYRDIRFQLLLVFKDGTKVALDHSKSVILGLFGGQEKSLGEKIASFLKVPLNSNNFGG